MQDFSVLSVNSVVNVLISSDATLVVELTPVGRGAVAVVLVAGPDALRAIDTCFVPVSGKRFAEAEVDRIVLGRWGDAGGEELIACRRANGTVEVHCHGGLAAVSAVIERLCAEGCERISWQEWVRQAESDPIRAAARVALAAAPTERVASVLLDQYQGALSQAVRTAAEAGAAGDWPVAVAAIDDLLAQRGVGLHLTTPWRVVIAGRPNVGKSSLLNALAGFQRAIVCDLPGTTRDVVTLATAIDGWPVELADTAGLRESADAIETAGVSRATAAIADADLLLLVEDASDLRADDDEWSAGTKSTLRVLNKVDLLSPTALAATDATSNISTSAATGAGIEDLVAAIARMLVPAPPAAGSAVPFLAEQFAALEAARDAAVRRDAVGFSECLRPLLVD